MRNGIRKTGDTDQLIPSDDGKRCLCHSCYVARNSMMKPNVDRDNQDFISEPFINSTEDVSNFKMINSASNVSMSQTYKNNDDSESPSESSPLHRYLNLPASEEERSTDDKISNDDVVKNEYINQNQESVDELKEDNQNNEEIIERKINDENSIKNPTEYVNCPSGSISCPNELIIESSDFVKDPSDSTNDPSDYAKNPSGLSNTLGGSLNGSSGIVGDHHSGNDCLLNKEDTGIDDIEIDVLDVINNITDDVVENEKTCCES